MDSQLVELRQAVRAVFTEALARTDPGAVTRERVAALVEDQAWAEAQVAVLALGKAAGSMLHGALEVLPPDRTKALALSSAPIVADVGRHLEVCIGEHPIPGLGSLAAGKRALEWLRALDAHTHVLFLISGGGSACCELPIDGFDLESLQVLSERLVEGGATIARINALRARLSQVKGGGLARAAAHCAVRHSLYLSDVEPGDLDSIASGPTRALPPVASLRMLVEELGVVDLVPRDLIARLEATASEGSVCGEHELLLDQSHLLEAAAAVACELGMHAQIDPWRGEESVEVLAQRLLTDLGHLRQKYPDQWIMLIAGGETSCPVRGEGLGGRNQELILRLSAGLRREQGVVALSCGSDGLDGNSPVAGALGDGVTWARARELGLDPMSLLDASDSYRLFQALGDVIETGPTGNNLRDLRLLVAAPLP